MASQMEMVSFVAEKLRGRMKMELRLRMWMIGSRAWQLSLAECSFCCHLFCFWVVLLQVLRDPE